MGPYRERHPSPEFSATHSLVIHLSLKVPSNQPPSMFPKFPNRVPMDTYFVSRASGLFVHSYCQSPQLRSPPTKTDKTFVHCPQSPRGTEGLHTVGCGLVLQLDCSQHCCHYSVPCSLHHNTFHLDVCRPEPRYPPCVVTLIRVSDHTCYHLPRDPG